MRATLRRGRRCAFELLEPRRALAGNVTAHLIGDDLYIVGDNGNNSIEVLGTDQPDEVLIRAAESGPAILGFYPTKVGADGVPFAVSYGTHQRLSLNPTTINGVSGPVRIGRVTGDVFIVTHGGDDFVGVSNLAVNGNLVLVTGAGDDGVLLGQFPRIENVGNGRFEFRPTPGSIGVQGSLQMNLGDGFDRQFASRTFVRGDVLIQAGQGEDRMQLITSSAANVSAVDPGGVSRFRMDDSAIHGAVTVVLNGDASDVDVNRSTALGPLSIVTGSAPDQVQLGNVRVDGLLVIVAGGGDDDLRLQASAVSGTVTVLAGDGADRFVVDVSRAFAVSADTGAGNDEVLITGSLINALYLALGDGDDWLNVSNTSVWIGSAAGGAGSDRIAQRLALDNFFVVEFEQENADLPISIAAPPDQYVPFLHQSFEPASNQSGNPGDIFGGIGLIAITLPPFQFEPVFTLPPSNQGT